IEPDIHTAVARSRMSLTATDGGRPGRVEDLESVVHLCPFDQAAPLGRGFFSSGAARGHDSRAGTARRFLAAGCLTVPAPPRQTGEPLGARERRTWDRSVRVASAHPRARGASRLPGHRPTAVPAARQSALRKASGVNGRWRGRGAHYDTAIVVGSSTTEGVLEPCHS